MFVCSGWWFELKLTGRSFLLVRKSEAAGDAMDVDAEGDVDGETKEQKKARKEAKKAVSV